MPLPVPLTSRNANGRETDRELNNTYLYDEQSDCDPSIIFNEKICQIRQGDYFVETDSSTFVKAPDLATAGGASQEITTLGTELGVKRLISSSLPGTDTLAVSSSKPLTLPIGIPRLRWDNGYTTLRALGLGSNSIYLNALVRAGQIPSRVWSIFWGRMWTDTGATDGQVVLGGYDRDKVIGRNFTQPLDYNEETGCWTGMRVTVSNLFVNFRNGSDFSIMPRNSAIQTCIVPHRQLLLEAPGAIVDAFETATQMNIGPSFGLHWSARLFNATTTTTSSGTSIFDGELTIVLSNGFSARIPNSQFLTPFVEIARNGSRVIDRSKRELLMNGLSDQPATLGRYFFTAAYLMVNHDAKTFTMWQANPSTSSTLVPVSNKDQPSGVCTDEEGTGTNGKPDADAPGSNNNNNNPGSTSPVNVGAIAGGVVSGVIILLVAIALAIFFIRRRRANKASANDTVEKTSTEALPRLSQIPPQEVHGREIYPYLAKPAELKGDRQYTATQQYHEVEGNGNGNGNGNENWKYNLREEQRSLYELDEGRT